MQKQSLSAFAPTSFSCNYLWVLLYLFSCLSYNNVYTQPIIEWDKTLGGDNYEELHIIIPTNDDYFMVGGMSNSGISGTVSQSSQGQADYWICKIDIDGNLIDNFRYGGNGADHMTCLQQTVDDGFILGGWSHSNIGGDKTATNFGLSGTNDFWIIKTDASGNIQWDKTFGGSQNDQLTTINQISDGFLLGGISFSDADGIKTDTSRGDADFWLIKTDLSGNKIWDKSYGGSGFDRLSDITNTEDGGFLLSGISSSNISGDKTAALKGGKDIWIIKIDSDGQIEWDKTFGGTGSDQCQKILATSEGDFLLGGSSDSGISEDKSEANQGQFDYWVIKIDVAGNALWDKTLGGSGDEDLQSINQNDKGNYILAGYSGSGISGDKTTTSYGSHDYWIVYLDLMGNKLADQAFGGSLSDDASQFISMGNGDYLLGGSSTSDASGSKTENNYGPFWTKDYWVVKLSCIDQIINDTFNLCLGQSLTLNAQNDLAQACTWLWSDGETQANRTISPNTSQDYSVTVSDVFGCSSTHHMHVAVGSDLTVNPTTPDPICAGQNLLLDATAVNCSNCDYMWNNGETSATPLVTPNNTTTYSVTVSDNIGCTNTADIDVAVVPLPEAIISTDPVACVGETINIEFSIIGTGPFDLTYSDGQNSYPLTGIGNNYEVSIVTDLSTLFSIESVSYSNGMACPNDLADTTSVTVMSIDTSYQSISICEGDSILLGGAFQYNSGSYIDQYTSFYGCDSLQITALALHPKYNQSLYFSSCQPLDTGVIVQNLQSIHGCDSIVTKITSLETNDSTWVNSNTCVESEAGIFEEVYQNIYGCDSIVFHNIQLNTFQVYTHIQNDICDDEEGRIFVDSVVGGQPPFLYGLDDSNLQTIPGFFHLPSNNYNILVQDADGCENNSLVTIPEVSNFEITINAPSQIELGDSVQLELSTNAPIDNLSWESAFPLSCTDCLYPIVYPTETMTYRVSAVSNDGCSATKKQRIFVNKARNVYLPNAFSPNGDGVNDLFELYAGKDVVSINYLRIFNRWGAVVFEASDFTAGDLSAQWDGQFKGKNALSGMYIVTSEVLFVDGRVELVTGEVSLVR